MAKDNNHISYNAADLLRYAQGQMPPQQMHALEKAALEDAFLADALDGYMAANSDFKTAAEKDTVTQKLNAFKSKIDAAQKEKKDAKIIPLLRRKWLQYAVAASVLLAGGWWILSLTKSPVQNKELIVAQNEPSAPSSMDSVSSVETVAKPVEPTYKNEEKSDPNPADNKNNTAVKKEKPVAAPGLAQKEPVNTNNTRAARESAKPDPNYAAKTTTDDAIASKSAAPAQVFKDQTNTQNNTGRAAMDQNKMAENNANNFANTRRYTFNGKVVDANNNPLPYSNIMIPGEGVGTYSDAKGNFNFVYVDSALPVKARSLGYEEKTYTMQPDVKENRIVLREDEDLKRKMVVNKQEKQARNQQYKPMIVERDSLFTAEPSVGWYDYNLYALNNSRAMELPSKRSVQLSFDVNKDGEVENITVEKSQGKELDDEAIRLLKEGPKWKNKKGPKSRGRVTLKL
ncbi:MAG: carboxypeptidase-like regulatory domain-containing protein [Bacteroidota bacterium]